MWPLPHGAVPLSWCLLARPHLISSLLLHKDRATETKRAPFSVSLHPSCGAGQWVHVGGERSQLQQRATDPGPGNGGREGVTQSTEMSQASCAELALNRLALLNGLCLLYYGQNELPFVGLFSRSCLQRCSALI